MRPSWPHCCGGRHRAHLEPAGARQVGGLYEVPNEGRLAGPERGHTGLLLPEPPELTLTVLPPLLFLLQLRG